MTPLLPQDWAVPEVFRRRLGNAAGRQRTMLAEGHLLLVLHDLPSRHRIDRVARFFWRLPDGQWRSAPGGGSGVATLQTHVERFAQAVQRLEQRADAAQQAGDYYRVLKELAPVHRMVINLHCALQEAREMVSEDRDLIILRDRAGEVERSAELLHADARHGLDYTIAHRAEEQAAASQRLVAASNRLNILASIFLPLTAAGAAFSMRLSSGMDAMPSPWTFWVIVAGALVLGLLLRATFMIDRHALAHPAKTGDETPPVEPRRDADFASAPMADGS